MPILSGRPPRPPGSLDRQGTFEQEKNPDIAASRNFRFPPASGSGRISTPGLGVGPQAPPSGAIPADAPFSRIQFPPRLEKITGSVDFRQQGYTFVLPAGIGSTVAGPTFQVPQGQVGWLQNNAIYVLTPVAVTSFRLTLFINDGPVPGFDDIQIPPGLANFILLGDDDMRVPIPNHGKVTSLFTNISGNAETVGALIQGWYHPLASEERVWGDDR